jgi:fatty-acyl-CoA synthase
MAAVIGARHPKGNQRPLVFIALKSGQVLERDEMLLFLSGPMANWQVPDAAVLPESLQLSGTDKVLKTEPCGQVGAVVTQSQAAREIGARVG